MKGIIANCQTGKVELIEDSLPQLVLAPWTEPERLDILQANQAIQKINEQFPGTITASPGSGALAGAKIAKTSTLTRIKSAITGFFQ